MRNLFCSRWIVREENTYFENVVHVKEDRLELSEDLIIRKIRDFMRHY